MSVESPQDDHMEWLWSYAGWLTWRGIAPMRAPVFIGELELTEPITGITLPKRQDNQAYTGVHLLVRMQHLPIGYAFLPPDALEPGQAADQVWRQLGSAINARRQRVGVPALEALPVSGVPTEDRLTYEPDVYPMITIVMCTRDRPQGAVATLRGLASLQYPNFEIVVVDNAPRTDATREAVAAEFGGDPNIRYVREPRPGLSCARNRGVAEANADIVAFTDDDIRVDPWWLIGIARGFGAAPDVACVTGLIATAELENAEQLYFHLHEEWGVGCERRLFDLTKHRDDSPLYPYSAGIYGAGANFALSRHALKELGDFDEALGAGTPSGGGEDLDMFMRVILSGHRIVYEPSAMLWHFHRTDLAALSRQMVAYGSGTTAALTAVVMRSRRARAELPPRIAQGVLRIFTLNNRTRDNPTLPTGLIVQEIRGLMIGPWLYRKGRRNLRRMSLFVGLLLTVKNVRPIALPISPPYKLPSLCGKLWPISSTRMRQTE
jgi:GT2 family glycosyltransferase